MQHESHVSFFRPFVPRPPQVPKVLHGVRVGHVPGVYTSWREAPPHTRGIGSDVKRFKSLVKAEEFAASSPDPTATIFTDGSKHR